MGKMHLTVRIEATISVTREQYDLVNAAEKTGVNEDNIEQIKEATQAMQDTVKVQYKGGGTPMSRNLLINAIANVLRRNPDWLPQLLLTLGVHEKMVEQTRKYLETNN